MSKQQISLDLRDSSGYSYERGRGLARVGKSLDNDFSLLNRSVTFDLAPPNRSVISNESILKSASSLIVSENGSVLRRSGDEVSGTSRSWDLDVRPLVSTKKWLQMHGLKSSRLDMANLVRQIAFKHSDDFDQTLKMPICSRYGTNLFQKYFSADGRTYNIICGVDVLRQIETRLSQAIALYKQRMEWLTSESRLLFGVIEERSVVIVLDFKQLSNEQFTLYAGAIKRVLWEQVSQISTFNLICTSGQDPVSFSEKLVSVSSAHITRAVEWVLTRTYTEDTGEHGLALCEALVQVLAMSNVEAVYIFSEGSIDDSRELIRAKVGQFTVPVHIVSFNCTSSDTVNYLKQLCKLTNARFHAYAVLMEMEAYERVIVDDPSVHSSLVKKKKAFGGIPNGAGVREDVIRLFEEMEEGRSNLAQIQALLENQLSTNLSKSVARVNGTRQSLDHVTDDLNSSSLNKNETYMSSRNWLEGHSLKAKHLDFYEALSSVAFQHQNGLVDLKVAPPHENCEPTGCIAEAVNVHKVVNARYCDKFGHVKWKDGRVMHVRVTHEFYRSYAERLAVVTADIQRRLDWLQRGSREIFGTVVENEIYLLIDTSLSMHEHIQFVKDKLLLLMQEQLRHKQMFNIVAFNSRANFWKTALTPVTEESLQDAWTWVKALRCAGTTNTLAALRKALDDKNTAAIYLLTDGRPDQPPRALIAQVKQPRQIPIHTISFNCNDREANEFLYDLARETGGRFHYYSEMSGEPDGPKPWQSEDTLVLKQEIAAGQQNLVQLAKLREECDQNAARKDRVTKSSKSSRKPLLKTRQKLDRRFSIPDDKDNYVDPLPITPHTSTPPLLPSAPAHPAPVQPEQRRPMSAPNFALPRSPALSSGRPHTAQGLRVTPARLSVTEPPVTISESVHIPASRSVNSGNKSKLRKSTLRSSAATDQFGEHVWLQPETKELFDIQEARIRKALQEEKRERTRNAKKKKKMAEKRKAAEAKSLSAKKWLAKHGLGAKRLTIMDLMVPTFIAHNPRFVPILKKSVSSKVFDDILPLGYSTNAKKQMQLINPTAVNFDKYQKNVKETIAEISRRLDCVVWNALTKEEKDKFVSEAPVSFRDNKRALMEALEQSGWLIREKDVRLLEDEILQGLSYLDQARALQEAAKMKLDDKDVDEVRARYSGEKTMENDNREKKKTRRERRSSESGNRRESLKRRASLKRRESHDGDTEEEQEDAEESPEKPRNYEKNKCRDDADRKNVCTQQREAKPQLEQKNLKVIARCSEDGYYYPGVIVKALTYRRALVSFDNSEIGDKEVSTNFIVPMIGAVTRPTLALCDYVLCRVIHDDTNIECYVPGKVVALPLREQNHRFYTVVLYTGQKSEFRRIHLVKISRDRYCLTLRYIKDLAPNYDNNEDVPPSPEPTSEPPDIDDKKRGKRKDSTREANTNTISSETDRKETQTDPRRWSPGAEELLKRLRHHMATLKKLNGTLGGQIEAWKLLKRLCKSDDIKEAEFRTNINKIQEEKQSISGRSSNDSESTTEQATALRKLLDLRRSLCRLTVGEEVLARWGDDGWYCRGVIQVDCGDESYLIEDSIGEREKIWRENIISDADDIDKDIMKGETVIAEHPDYPNSFCPGTVQRITSDESILVRFYDGREGRLERKNLFPIPEVKFVYDVSYIERCEQRLVGNPVVAFNDQTKLFQLGTVIDRVGHSYTVRWADGSESQPESSYMFGPFTRQRQLVRGDFVLALGSTVNVPLVYLPGKVDEILANDQKLIINFYDASRSSPVDEDECFRLSEDYYNRFVELLRQQSQTAEPAITERRTVSEDKNNDKDEEQSNEPESDDNDEEEEDEEDDDDDDKDKKDDEEEKDEEDEDDDDSDDDEDD